MVRMSEPHALFPGHEGGRRFLGRGTPVAQDGEVGIGAIYEEMGLTCV